VFADHVPVVSATAADLLERAGWTNVGKTNLHEFAYGVTSQNLHYGTVPNPSYPGRTAGGSSGGSAAALAAGLADAALGTDSGGSIRIPAACCRVVGFKPTFGLVSTDGVFPLAPSYDHAGPMARDVETCAALMRLLGGVGSAAGPFRVGLDVHRELYAEHADLYGENIRPKIERCLVVTDTEAAAAAAARVAYEREALAALEGFDLLLTPTLAFVPPPADVDEIATRVSMIRFTYPFNLLGWPALALPCGPAEEGLPASAQLVGRPGADAQVLAAGAHLEAELEAVLR
jgi:Asp-tRNA(Asn)/Glu-tRNA(Gln) amidotransferase A subunit family amidase